MSETAVGTDDEKSTEPLQLVGSVDNRHDHAKNDRQSGKPVAAKSSKNRDRLSKRWQCPSCSFVNSCRHRRCIMCEFDSYLQPQLNDSGAVDEEEDRKEPANPSLSGEDSLVGPEDELWRCAKCTFKNKHKSRYCEICGVKNETGKPATAAATKDPTTTDAVAAGSSSIEKRKRPQSKTDTELGVAVDEKSLSDAVVVEQPPAVEQEASNSDDDEAKPADMPPVNVGEASKDSIEQPVSGPHRTGGDAVVVEHVNESSMVSEDVKPATKEPVKKGNTCPLCTFNNPREYRYCDMCGTQLEQAVPSRSVKTPSTVRRSTGGSKPAAAVDVKTEAVDEGPPVKAKSSSSSSELAPNSRKRRDREIADYKAPANKRRRNRKPSASTTQQTQPPSQSVRPPQSNAAESKAVEEDSSEDADSRGENDDSSVRPREEAATAAEAPKLVASTSATRKSETTAKAAAATGTATTAAATATTTPASPTKRPPPTPAAPKRSAATPARDVLLTMHVPATAAVAPPVSGAKAAGGAHKPSPRAALSTAATAALAVAAAAATAPSSAGGSAATANAATANGNVNGKTDKVARAERAAEMQAIYELTFSTPPPLKRGMVIVWDCVHCKTQNAIREAACMHCSAAQVHRYHYVALCTHYKALEGRRQKRLAELEGGDGAPLATAPPATAAAASSSSSSATPSAMRQPRERDSARSGRASSGGARQSAAKQPPSSSSAAVAVDEAGATPVTSRSRRGGGRAEPRKPRIPIISQYPHKAPKIGPDHQVDVDALPNPAQFVKTALDYTVYFDRLPLPPDAVDELSPWEYNNAYYDVLWMARDQYVDRSQPCAMAQCPIAAERSASLSQATPPPPPPQRLLVAPSASLALAAVATTTAAAAAAEAAVDEAAGVAAPVAVHSDAMDVDGSAIDDDVAVTVASADDVAAAEVAGSAAAVVAAVVADVVDEAATAAAAAASATVGSGHQRASRVAEAPSTSFTVVAQRVQPSDAAVSDADASENLLRGLDNATLSTLYPVLALRQLYQHRYELDAVHASFAQTVLRHHRHTAIVFRDRPCRPLVPDAVEDAAAAAAEAAAAADDAAAPTDAAAAALSSPVPPSQPPQLPPVAAPAIDAQAAPTATATATVQRLHLGPLDLPLLELSAVDRARFQQALIRHGNDEWNAVARELRGDYTVGQLQDFYYGSWTTRYRALAQETDRLQRNFKRSAAGKRPRRTSHTSRELSNLLLDQERSNFLAEFGGRVSSKNRDRRQRSEGVSIVQHDKDRVADDDDEDADADADAEGDGDGDADEEDGGGGGGGGGVRQTAAVPIVDAEDDAGLGGGSRSYDDDDGDDDDDGVAAKRPRLMTHDDGDDDDDAMRCDSGAADDDANAAPPPSQDAHGDDDVASAAAEDDDSDDGGGDDGDDGDDGDESSADGGDADETGPRHRDPGADPNDDVDADSRTDDNDDNGDADVSSESSAATSPMVVDDEGDSDGDSDEDEDDDHSGGGGSDGSDSESIEGEGDDAADAMETADAASSPSPSPSVGDSDPPVGDDASATDAGVASDV